MSVIVSVPTLVIGHALTEEPPVGSTVSFHPGRGLEHTRTEEGYASELGLLQWDRFLAEGKPIYLVGWASPKSGEVR